MEAKSMLEELKEKVCRINKELVSYHLVTFTWGNVSAIDRERGLVIIKPSGVIYDLLKPKDMVVVDLHGKIIEGKLRPSSDTPTHIELYKAFPEIGGIIHTHSTFATSWAQAGRDIPCYGTTQADYFYGSIPCVGVPSREEVEGEYEKNTGLSIVHYFQRQHLDVTAVPGALAQYHGVFSWGKDPEEAIYHAVVMERVAEMALYTESINLGVKEAPSYLIDKHYQRKHGKHAYYGQKNESEK
jgi:L-ribulose-5-phosphate 4-epimerase